MNEVEVATASCLLEGLKAIHEIICGLGDWSKTRGSNVDASSSSTTVLEIATASNLPSAEKDNGPRKSSVSRRAILRPGRQVFTSQKQNSLPAPVTRQRLSGVKATKMLVENGKSRTVSPVVAFQSLTPNLAQGEAATHCLSGLMATQFNGGGPSNFTWELSRRICEPQ